MNTDSIGGRKFIGYILSMFGWFAVLYVTLTTGNFKADSPQNFMFFMVLVQGIFFGSNLAEKYILSFTANTLPKGDIK
jgi:hypothetical protein